MEMNGVRNARVHGNAIISSEVSKAENIGNAVWVVPDWGRIITKISLLCQGNNACVAM